ncbi:apolipoprotein N-acyltransferase [Caulobacter sp. CCG-8]|uniref:apolipoprotein N-acyltransferase n=1 Tax=Caulobacter sp. CCG-8 TaxID=3127958 RepID=UPI00307F817E
MNLPALPKSTPWRVRGLALLAGLAAALAHPPFGILPGLLGYAVLLWLLDTIDGPRPLRSAFLRGWLMGLSYFALSTWWIAEAFMVDAANQGWMAPFAVAAMAAGMALFWGLGAVLYRLIRPAGVRRVLVFAGAFALLEWTRGHILTGFPWNLPGETWRAGSAVSQFAGVVGAYGLTWITLAIAAVPAVWRDGRRGRIAVGAAAVALVGLFVGGALALSRPPSAPGPALTVRVVQADIPQESKWDAQRFAQIVQAYVSLTAKPYAGKPADIVVWPEGALPLAINDYMVPGSWVRQDIVAALRPGQLMLLGGYRYEGPPDKPVYYNSLVALRRTADDVVVVGIYDKHRLVPFGEYLPADALMTRIGFKSMAHLGDGFATGPKPAPLRVAPDLLVQPLICYESLFPRLAKPVPGVRAIVNVSNDAWFGVTSGPLQHLNLASYRAIETGLPLIRATPTGVSALIDARGRILPGARLKLGESGVIDGKVSEVGSPTLFSKLGHWPFGLLLLVSFLAAIRVPGGRGLEKGLN